MKISSPGDAARPGLSGTAGDPKNVASALVRGHVPVGALIITWPCWKLEIDAGQLGMFEF